MRKVRNTFFEVERRKENLVSEEIVAGRSYGLWEVRQAILNFCIYLYYYSFGDGRNLAEKSYFYLRLLNNLTIFEGYYNGSKKITSIN